MQSQTTKEKGNPLGITRILQVVFQVFIPSLINRFILSAAPTSSSVSVVNALGELNRRPFQSSWPFLPGLALSSLTPVRFKKT